MEFCTWWLALGHAIIFLSIPDESQKEKEKGTDIKFPGFRPLLFFSKLTGVRDKRGGC